MKKSILNLKSLLLLAFILAITSWNCQVVYALEEVMFEREITEGLQEPVDTAVAQNGDIYVLDRSAAKVFVYSEDGTLRNSFGNRGSDLGQLNSPRSIALTDKGNVLVADTGNSRVQAFGPDGTFLYQLLYYNDDQDSFRSPDSIAIDRSGKIFIGDSDNKTISKFSVDGTLLEHRKLDFTPTDLVFDREEKLYILMPGIGRIVKFDLETEDYDLISFKMKGRNLISKTADIFVDAKGHIYLLETGSHSIKKIDQERTLLFSFGSKGIEKGQFDTPLGIASDNTGRIYVADAKNKRVQVLAEGERVTLVKQREKPSPPLANIADNDNRIYVTKVSRPVQVHNMSERMQYDVSKRMLLDELKNELAFRIGIHKDALSRYLKIESEELMDSGAIKLTVSLPKQIPHLTLETGSILSKM